MYEAFAYPQFDYFKDQSIDQLIGCVDTDYFGLGLIEVSFREIVFSFGFSKQFILVVMLFIFVAIRAALHLDFMLF